MKLKNKKGMLFSQGRHKNKLRTGRLIVWKNCLDKHYKNVLVKLEIPASADRVQPVPGNGGKCRAEYAKVLWIEGGLKTASSWYANGFKYRLGKFVRPERPLNIDTTASCRSGIHFFIKKLTAKRFFS